ncbi:MAG: eIF2B alpha/beta/delta subunit family protein [Candidatus Acidiferrales bacterium]
MDQRLRRDLNAIASDRSSGAVELARCACAALQQWVRRHPKISRDEILTAGRALLIAQPAMAPLLRLANELVLAAEQPAPSRYLALTLTQFSSTMRTGPARIARHFRSALGKGEPKIIITYSYSSTVLQSIVAARSHIWQVICSEGRPGLEGRKTVEQILRLGKGVNASLTTDAALHMFTTYSYALVVGADSLEVTGFTNKAGTAALVAYALQIGRPVWVLADTSKLLPSEIDALRNHNNDKSDNNGRYGPDSEIWTDPPRRLTLLNPYFEKTRYQPGVRILSEHGWRTPAQILRDMRAIKVSPLLAGLLKGPTTVGPSARSADCLPNAESTLPAS